MATVLWFTGLSGAGKSTIAQFVCTRLKEQGVSAEIIDGDAVRSKAHAHLRFTREDIKENNRLIAELAKNGLAKTDVVLVPVISPFEESRRAARALIGPAFIEVYVRASEAARRARDPKGLYKKMEQGDLTDMIGHGGVPYEEPLHPDVVLDTEVGTPEESAERLIALLATKGIL